MPDLRKPYAYICEQIAARTPAFLVDNSALTTGPTLEAIFGWARDEFLAGIDPLMDDDDMAKVMYAVLDKFDSRWTDLDLLKAWAENDGVTLTEEAADGRPEDQEVEDLKLELQHMLVGFTNELAPAPR